MKKRTRNIGLVILHAVAALAGAVLWQLGMYGQIWWMVEGYVVGAVAALAAALAYEAWRKWGQMRAGRLLRTWGNYPVE